MDGGPAPAMTVEAPVRITIDIDDALLTEAMRATGASTAEAAVVAGLRLLVRLARQRQAVEDMIGLGWEGDLAASRETRA
jgi:Arc/MetJ family transcription regulator